MNNHQVAEVLAGIARIPGRREPTLLDIDRAIEAAVDNGKVLEVNAYKDGSDLSGERLSFLPGRDLYQR